VLINTLACLGKEDGWVLAEGVEGENSGSSRKSKRRIVTLDDVRRDYQGELDRRSEMQQGRFSLLVDGESIGLMTTLWNGRPWRRGA